MRKSTCFNGAQYASAECLLYAKQLTQQAPGNAIQAYVAIVHYVTLQLSVRDVTGVCVHMCTFGKCKLLVL